MYRFSMITFPLPENKNKKMEISKLISKMKMTQFFPSSSKDTMKLKQEVMINIFEYLFSFGIWI